MEKVILAPSKMHKILLSNCRKEDLFANPKLLTKEEFLGKYYGNVTPEGVYYLFKNKDFIYDNLMQVVSYIPYADDNCVRSKNKMLNEWRKELDEAGFLEKDEFFEQFIKDKEFEIYGYSKNDIELLSLLNTYKNKYEFKDFTKGYSVLSVNKFPLLEDEIFYVLNQISELLENGVSPDDIYIYVDNENALFYLKRYVSSFGFTINFPNSQSLYSQESITEFLKVAKQAQSFDAALEVLDNEIKTSEEIKNTLHELCFVDLEFEKKFDYIASYLKTMMIQDTRYENAVNIISAPIYDENKYIFIPCFAQNIYPKSYKDNGYISDADKEELHVLTSLEKCRIEDAISKDFLLSNNKFILSRSSASFSERYFASPFINSLGIKEVEIKDLPEVIYSKKYGEYRLGIDKDNKLYFLQESRCADSLEHQLNFNYRNYDNQYSDAQAVSPDTFLDLSYTSVKEYYSCPFQYYLDNILKISVFEDTFYTKLGKVAHYVFEHQYDKDFDFDVVFETEKKNYTWEVNEELFLERLKEDIKQASDACLKHFNTYATNPKILTEKELFVKLDPHTRLKGFVDKIMLLDNSEAILVDYKTGSESFDRNKLEYGLSMQLPTYAYLFHNTKEYEDYHIAGLYINNVINTSYGSERGEDEPIDSYLKLNGVTVADMKVIKKIDASIVNDKSLFLKGVALKKDGNFKKSSSLVGDTELKEMEDLVLEKYKEAARKIRNNEFEISPLFIEEGGACKFCEYRDICFVKASQRRGKNDKEDDDNGDEVV